MERVHGSNMVKNAFYCNKIKARFETKCYFQLHIYNKYSLNRRLVESSVRSFRRGRLFSSCIVCESAFISIVMPDFIINYVFYFDNVVSQGAPFPSSHSVVCSWPKYNWPHWVRDKVQGTRLSLRIAIIFTFFFFFFFFFNNYYRSFLVVQPRNIPQLICEKFIVDILHF